MYNSPFDRPSHAGSKKAKKSKKKAKKKKARKARKAKKAASPRPARKRLPVDGYARPSCPARKRQKSVKAEVIRVPKAEFEKLRKNVARPLWTDQLPESKRKIIKRKGRMFWPLYGLLFVVDSVEIVPLGRWSGKTHTQKQGALLRPGYVQKIGSKKYVYDHRVQFVQQGSVVDV